jgi:hypothetical protein
LSTSSSHASPGIGAHKSRVSDSSSSNSKASRDSLDHDKSKEAHDEVTRERERERGRAREREVKSKETHDEVRAFTGTAERHWEHGGQRDISAGGGVSRRELESHGEVRRKVVSIGRIQLVKYQLRESFEDW